VRIDALSERAGPIIAVHPLRISSGGEGTETDEAETGSILDAESRLDGTDSGPEWSEDFESETQAEFEL
jgi:hypothetical protein